MVAGNSNMIRFSALIRLLINFSVVEGGMGGFFI
jgi:hypothetical protein